MTQAYPLAWPDGWPRTPERELQNSRYRFKRPGVGGRAPWTFGAARDELYAELRRLKAEHIVVSSNFKIDRRTGLALEGDRRPKDQGIAAYFVLNKRSMVMACDVHQRAEENMRSLALAIDAMRQLERHGGGRMMERAFSGFEALPPPSKGAEKAWWEVLGVSERATAEEIEAAFRHRAKMAHPDQGGTTAAMQELLDARNKAHRLRAAA